MVVDKLTESDFVVCDICQKHLEDEPFVASDQRCLNCSELIDLAPKLGFVVPYVSGENEYYLFSAQNKFVSVVIDNSDFSKLTEVMKSERKNIFKLLFKIMLVKRDDLAKEKVIKEIAAQKWHMKYGEFMPRFVEGDLFERFNFNYIQYLLMGVP